MPAQQAIVRAAVGLHARPAAVFVRAVTDTGFPVTISKRSGRAVDARSLLQVMSEDFGYGCEVRLEVRGDRLPAGFSAADAEHALAGLCALLEAQTG